MLELALNAQIDAGIDFRVVKQFTQGWPEGIIAISILDFRLRQQRVAAPFLRFVLAQQIEFQRLGLDVLNETFQITETVTLVADRILQVGNGYPVLFYGD